MIQEIHNSGLFFATHTLDVLLSAVVFLYKPTLSVARNLVSLLFL